MKSLLFLLALLASQVQAQSQALPALEVSAEFVGAGTYHCAYGLDGCHVRLGVKNMTTATRSFSVWSCSWRECWSINKTVVSFPALSCDKNVPEKIDLAPGQEVVFYGFVVVNKKADKIDIVDNTKQFQDKEYEIRFAFTEVSWQEMEKVIEGSNHMIGKTYWSEPIAVVFPDNSFQIKPLVTK